MSKTCLPRLVSPELFTTKSNNSAKTIPLDTIAAKPAAGGAQGRRSAANAAAGDAARVDLGEGATAKKGGCC